MDRIQLAQNRAPVNFRAVRAVGNVLMSWATISFPRRSMPLGLDNRCSRISYVVLQRRRKTQNSGNVSTCGCRKLPGFTLPPSFRVWEWGADHHNVVPLCRTPNNRIKLTCRPCRHPKRERMGSRSPASSVPSMFGVSSFHPRQQSPHYKFLCPLQPGVRILLWTSWY